MWPISILLSPFHNDNNIERGTCSHGVFYRCGNFVGCCGIDPCAFLSFDNPCAAAQAEGGDGSDDGNDTTTVDQPTLTVSLSSFSTKKPNTVTSTASDDPETSTTTTSSEDSETSSSSAQPSQPTSVVASTTTDGTTLSTSVASTSTSTTGSATSTLPAPFPTATTSPDQGSGDTLSRSAIVAVTIVGAAGAVVLLVAFFWFARRRRLSKRMSSARGGSPTPSMVFDFGFATGHGGNPTGAVPRAQEGGSPPPVSDIRAPYAHLQQQPAEPAPIHAELDYAELDSAEMQRPGPSLSPGHGRDIQRSLSAQSPDMTPALPRRPSLPSVRVHPPQLTPGFGGAQMAAQQQHGGSRGDNVSGQNHRDSTNAPWVVPRATLNATEDERMNHQYANSWAYGP
ncbi:hypothetical protein F5Y12DRAFT_559603 [Xylaria sp. FL1777]|nr:hypothetical protein F5Y12DRAFT_559603 [Xylaria sp. FL1777]